MREIKVSVHERVRSSDYLEWLAREANQAAAWLAEQGLETEADLVESAARTLLATCHMLERPLRPELPPERWQQADGGQGVPSQQAPDLRK
jgi:hypothetical protein